jgi:hypothetical protein
MNESQNFTRQAAVFAESVRRQLRHLPSEVVADLTDGIETDIASSLSDGATLSSISDYATDLMRGAGIHIQEPDNQDKVNSFVAQAREWVLKGWTWIQQFTNGLAPAWWVIRAWVFTQLTGNVLSDADSARPLLNQWGEKGIVGLVVFAISLYFSIRIGRGADNKYKKAIAVVNIVLVVIGLQFGFASTNSNDNAGYYPDASYDSCPMKNIPSVVGLPANMAQDLLLSEGIMYEFFDQDAMMTLARVPDDAIVTQQDPSGPQPFCPDIEQRLQLVVDLSVPVATTTMPSSTESTTTPSKNVSPTTSVVKNPTTTSLDG